MNPDDVLFERFNAIVTAEHMQTLLPATWLNDEVINQFMSLLQQDGPNTTFFYSTFFYTKLMEGNKYSYKNVERWIRTRAKNINTSISDFVKNLIKLIIPVHLRGNHWALVSVEYKEKKLRYYDGFGYSGKPIMKNIMRYIRKVSKLVIGRSYSDSRGLMNEWEFVDMGSSVPQQSNGFDCGVFCCMYALCLARGVSMDFHQRDMPDIRNRFVADIMEGRLKWTTKDFPLPREDRILGIPNIGNSCYLNVLLQVLSQLPG
jgi:sentrin-specific protease 1